MANKEKPYEMCYTIEPPRPLKTAKEDFRCVLEGTGGTINMDQSISRVGVVECYSSVGVYFKFDPKHCFCANIKVDVTEKSLSAKQGEQLSNLVTEKLKQTAKEDNWLLEHESFGGLMTIMCHRPNFQIKGKTRLGAGHYIIESLQAFMLDCIEKIKPLAAQARPGCGRHKASLDLSVFNFDQK